MRYEFTEGDLERFWAFVVKTETCWLFQGTPSQRYGLFGLNGKSVLAHRFAYQIQVGDIPKGLEVLHHCDVMRCVRGDDLFVGTQQANIDDMVMKGRKALSPGYHPTGERHWTHLSLDDRLLMRERAKERRRERERLARIQSALDRGGCHPTTKLSSSQIHEIQSRYAAGGIFQSELAEDYGVNQATISRVVTLKRRA